MCILVIQGSKVTETKWCRSRDSNSDERYPRGILSTKRKGRRINVYLIRRPFPVSESYEECSTVRGVWTPRWTPDPSPVCIPRSLSLFRQLFQGCFQFIGRPSSHSSYFTSSKSPGFQVLSNHGSSGP